MLHKVHSAEQRTIWYRRAPSLLGCCMAMMQGTMPGA